MPRVVGIVATADTLRQDATEIARRYTRPSGAPTAKFLLLVGCLSIFGPLCVDMYLPALPKIALGLGATTSDVQLSLTTCLVGIAVGQLVYGAVSDQVGRRAPLVSGLALFIAASLCCSFAPNAALLALFRFLEGLGGAAGIVISRAIVRDLFDGHNAARVFSMLMLITGIGPVFAPQMGAGILTFTSWRGVFVSLAIAGAGLLTVASLRLPETLDRKYRVGGGFAVTFAGMRRVGSSLSFLQHAISAGLGFGAVIAYVSGASFVIENIYHASPQLFGLLFAVNACGLIAASQLNGRLVGRVGANRLMTIGLVGLAVSSIALLIVVVGHKGGLPAVLVCMFGTMCSNGFIGPNATALSLEEFPDVAGSASALLGLGQFGLGACIAPLVGIGGSHDAFPMALCMVVLGLSGLSARLFLTRRAVDPRAGSSLGTVHVKPVGVTEQ